MDKRDRAAYAQSIVDNPVVNEFFDEFRTSLFKRWLSSKTVEEREEIHKLITVSDTFAVRMHSYIADGKKLEENNG